MSNITFDLLTKLESYHTNDDVYKKINKQLYELNKKNIAINRAKFIEYQKQKGNNYHNDSKSNNKNSYNKYNKKNTTAYKPKNGLKSKMLFSDKYEIIFNKECSKITSANITNSIDSVINTFVEYIYDKINLYIDNYLKLKVRMNNDSINFEDFNYQQLFNKYEQYQISLWNILIKRMIISQNNHIYNQFINELINKDNNYIKSLISKKLNEIRIYYNNLYTKSTIPGSDKYLEYFGTLYTDILDNISSYDFDLKILLKQRNNLINVIYNFINNNDIISGSQKYIEELNKACNVKIDLDIENNYKVLGQFIKYTNKIKEHKTKENKNKKEIYTTNGNLISTLIDCIYNNFNNLVDLLSWEPFNLEELEKRVYFIIGFLENNESFIKYLTEDTFNDFVSILEKIKTSEIPPIIKYKVFDIVDNFKELRNK